MSEVLALVRAELRAELRAGHVLMATVPFAIAALLVAALAVGADTPLLRRIGPGIYWMMVVLFGSLVTVRQTLADRPARRDLLALLGVDPVLQWSARSLATALLLGGLQALLLPVLVVLYDPPLEALAAQAAVAVAAAVGIAALGTVAADLAGSDAARSSLVPLLVIPFSVPIVLAGVQVQESAIYGASVAPWVALAVLTDLLIILAGWLSARPLQEISV